MRRLRARVITPWLVTILVACTDTSDDPGVDSLRLGEPVSETRFDPVEASDTVQQSTASATGDTLCASCTGNLTCGTGNYCLARSDGVRFCGRDCRTTPCPTGYSCLALGTSVSQCVPTGGSCASTLPDAGGTRDAGVASGDAGLAGGGDVPSSSYCAPAAQWSTTSAGYETEVLRLANLRRKAGASCGTIAYVPAPPLTMSPALRCAARLHSKDMSDRGYFMHTTPEGITFSTRIDRAGYVWRTVGENIASGYTSPQAVVDGWMGSPGHCKNIMNPAFTQIGVGMYGAYVWTQDFGAAL